MLASATPSKATPKEVAREFRSLQDGGVRMRAAGTARNAPELLRRYTPRYKIQVEDTAYYLTDVRQNPDLRFFVAYVHLASREHRRNLYPRIFYKDVSLVWRSASHFVRSETENWIGKGEARPTMIDGEEVVCSAEETTDLPLEIQTALETLLQLARPIRTDHVAVERILRRGGDDRIEPFDDFTLPRERARANPANRVNGGRSVAWFERPGDPKSLVIAPGYEPDFARGVVETSRSRSRLYGGNLRRFRIVSRNREIQYLFIAGRRIVWIVPPQATSWIITPYGSRAIDVITDEDLCLPGYEFHFLDTTEDPPVFLSQIPEGYAGKPSPLDPDRCDASPWIDELPVVKQFRRRILGQSR